MKITIIGASAGVGLEVVKRALERGHSVTTLSRSSVSVPFNKNLVVMKGSAIDKADLEASLRNADVAIIALGTGNSMKATTLYSDFARVLCDVVKEKNLNIPFLILTGFGAGESGKYNTLVMKIFFKLFLKDVYADKTDMEKIISSELRINWTFVRPGLLKNKPLTENYRVETQLVKGIKIRSIGRADVADYLVKQAENPTDAGKYPALSEK